MLIYKLSGVLARIGLTRFLLEIMAILPLYILTVLQR